MTKQILAFLFCFIRELNPYSPLGARTQNPPPPRALSLWLNRVKDSTNPLLPPYIHPKARGFIKPLVLTLTLRLEPLGSIRVKDSIKPEGFNLWFYHPPIFKYYYVFITIFSSKKEII